MSGEPVQALAQPEAPPAELVPDVTPPEPAPPRIGSILPDGRTLGPNGPIESVLPLWSAWSEASLTRDADQTAELKREESTVWDARR